MDGPLPHQFWVETFALQVSLLQFVSGSDVNLIDESNKNWSGISWQLFSQALIQLFHVNLPIWVGDGDHASPSLSARDLNPKDDAVPQPDNGADGGFHLHGRHVFSLPSESVARPVLEVKPSQIIHH